MLRQVAWTDAATAAFAAAYAEDGQADAHREEVAAGRELLMECADYGFITLRLEPRDVAVITGAACSPGAFGPVLAALEAFFPCVCVETYREGLVMMLKKAGYMVDHLRLYKRVK